MSLKNGVMPSQHIGNTVLVVTLEVDEADEAEFNKWYNEQHLPERMAIPGYISARRLKLKGDNNNNALKYLCIWEMEDGSPLESEMYKDQNAHPTELYLRVNETIKSRPRGLSTPRYTQIKGLLSKTVLDSKVNACLVIRSDRGRLLKSGHDLFSEQPHRF